MQSIFSRLAAGLLGAAAASTLFIVPAFADPVKITILGVGDIYQFEGGKVRGGFARLNAVAKAEKAANPNLLYLHDGDMISPSLLSGLDQGSNTIELTNVVPFDLAVPGNHEFDFGPAVFMDRLKQSTYPWAAINIAGPDGKPVDGLGSTIVTKEIAGIKIALVPIADDETPVLATTEDWKFTPSLATALDAAQKARDDGADLVIAVTHTGHADDDAMVASHKFDLVISGHDHDYRTGYDGITAYSETSTEANFLTAVDLSVDVQVKDGKRTLTWTPAFRFIDTATVTPDPDTQAIVDTLKAKLSSELDVNIGTATSALDSRRAVVRGEESIWGDIATDAMRKATGADIAIFGGGSIRGDKQYPAGTVLTRKDVFTELPFGDKTVVTELTGKAVLDALENGFSQIEQGAGRFPQVSGLVVTVDAKKAVGARVISVLVNGKPLDPAATYKVATNDYSLGGGDGYTALGTGTVLIDASAAHLLASDVVDYITALKTIDTKIEGRLIITK